MIASGKLNFVSELFLLNVSGVLFYFYFFIFLETNKANKQKNPKALKALEYQIALKVFPL